MLRYRLQTSCNKQAELWKPTIDLPWLSFLPQPASSSWFKHNQLIVVFLCQLCLPVHAHLPAGKGSVNKSNFLGLFPKSGKDQWDCEIDNYYVALPIYNSKNFSISTWISIPFWNGFGWKVLNVGLVHTLFCNSVTLSQKCAVAQEIWLGSSCVLHLNKQWIKG